MRKKKKKKWHLKDFLLSEADSELNDLENKYPAAEPTNTF